MRQWLAVALLCFLMPAGALLAGDGGIRSSDQVWLASTRHISCGVGEPALWQWNAGQWLPSDREAFHQQNGDYPHTIVYIHGNRVDDDEGASGGLAVYQRIVAAHAGEGPVRFVIWSWPATKICGPIKDVRTKAWQSDDEAVMLAQFLDGIHKPESQAKECVDRAAIPISTSRQPSEPDDYRVGFVAFSYGARITGGALQLLAGGHFDGMTIPRRDRPQFRAAFWAAAAHNDWLLQGNRHGEAIPIVDKWFSTTNRCDESLWRYERLEKGGNPPALGFEGFSRRGELPADLQARWEEWEVSSIVGRTHNYHPYVSSSWIAEKTANCVLWKK